MAKDGEGWQGLFHIPDAARSSCPTRLGLGSGPEGPEGPRSGCGFLVVGLYNSWKSSILLHNSIVQLLIYWVPTCANHCSGDYYILYYYINVGLQMMNRLLSFNFYSYHKSCAGMVAGRTQKRFQMSLATCPLSNHQTHGFRQSQQLVLPHICIVKPSPCFFKPHSISTIRG